MAVKEECLFYFTCMYLELVLKVNRQCNMSLCISDISFGHTPLLRQSNADGSSDDSIYPRKLNGSLVEAPSYQQMHRELLLSHKRYTRLTLKAALLSDLNVLNIFDRARWRVFVLSCYSVQGPAAGGEAGTETSAGAAPYGAAQGGGDGTTAALWSGDGAPQEAAEAAGGQKHFSDIWETH